MSESCLPYEWIISHIWTLYQATDARDTGVSHEYVYVYVWIVEWVMSPIWVNHITHMNPVPSHRCTGHRSESYMCICTCMNLWVSHVTHVSESCLTYVQIMSNVWDLYWSKGATHTHIHQCRSHHHTHIHASCHIYEYHLETNLAFRVTSMTHVRESCHTYVSEFCLT